ncbi:MAG TPA: DUF2163 domain-containing protein [Sphingomicrobium sp.]
MASIVDGDLTSIALCWRLERSDGAGIALTSHDERLTVGDTVHEPSPGIVPAAITRTIGLEPHSGEIAGAVSAKALEPADLALGRWDGARARLSAIDWHDADAAPIDLLGAELGNVSLNGESFSAELRGAAARLAARVCPATSAECRAHFGDKRCQVDLAGRTIAATALTSGDGELTLDIAVDEKYLLGRLRYMSGANCGLSTSIIHVDGTLVRVRDLPRAPIEPGCRIELREGCDKRFETCVQRFANAVNFRGEPHLPGNDLLTRYPGV